MLIYKSPWEKNEKSAGKKRDRNSSGLFICRVSANRFSLVNLKDTHKWPPGLRWNTSLLFRPFQASILTLTRTTSFIYVRIVICRLFFLSPVWVCVCVFVRVCGFLRNDKLLSHSCVASLRDRFLRWQISHSSGRSWGTRGRDKQPPNSYKQWGEGGCLLTEQPPPLTSHLPTTGRETL